MDHLTGQTFKGYELRECLGQGGFGAVYRAFQPLLGRDVAVKVIRPEFANHPDFIRRFETEAQVVARLEHPHIVPLYDYWRDPAGAFLVMRWLRGGSLRDALAAGPLALPLTVHVLEHLAGALTAAHRRGVVHRDLKPANVLRDEDGNAYLADFGIAKDISTPLSTGNTATDAVVGSPAYMAPEQIKQEPVTPQTDIYLLGVLLYEVLTGQQPFAGATPTDLLYQHLYEPLPLLRIQRPDLPGALDTVLQQATQKAASARYPDALNLLADFAAASGVAAEPRVAGPPALPVAVAALVEPANPYKGLRAFQEADTADFFGREALVAQLLARLGERGPAGHFLAVVGPSGSGKSSVVRAGLLPALRQGAVPGSERWFVTEFVPGPHPLEELEAALLRVAVNPPASLLEQLQCDPRGLSRAVKRVLPADERTELVLLIDQFEEVFTLVEDERLRAHLLNSLALAVADPRSRLRVILTLRADFYDRPLLYADLGELMRRGTELVLPLTARELEQAIAGPAARVNVTLEPALLAATIQDVGDQPGALPLLQYALTELFEHRAGRQMTLAGYQASGGVLGALARRAEEIYAALAPEAQALARQVFLRLVTLGEGVEDTRRRVRRQELAGLGPAEALNAVLDGFGQYRLLTFDRDPITREPTVEVAHEALLRTWGRLREWLDASRMEVRTQRQLAAVAAEWEGAERDPSFLASGTRLAQFAALAGRSQVTLTPDEQAYLATSQAETERQAATERERQAHELELARQSAAAAQQAATAQRRAANWLRGLVGGLTIFLAVAAALAVFAFGQQSEATSQRQAAQNNAATAVANGAEANAQRATAVSNGAEAQRQNGLALAAAATAQADSTHANALRLAAEAKNLMLTGGQSELAGLLSLRSLQLGYTVEGDAALEGAAQLDYPVRRFVGHGEDQYPVAQAVALSPDGKTLYTQTGSSTRLWDVATGRQVANIDFGGDSVSWAPDGKHILATHDDGTLLVWDTAAMTYTLSPITSTARVWWAVYSPNGHYILTAGRGKSKTEMAAQVWDAATGRQIQVFQGSARFSGALAWSPDGRYVLTGDFDNIARLWDVQTGLPVRTFQTGLPPGFGYGAVALAFAPDGKTIAVSALESIQLWDVATGTLLRELRGHTDVAITSAFLPDGKTLLTSSWDSTVRLWDVATGQQLRVLRGPNLPCVAGPVTPDGRQVAVAYQDGTVLLWDLGGPAHPPMPAGGSLNTVTFSADDRLVLTGSPAGRVARLFDAASGRQLVPEFPGPQGSTVNSAVFSRDGKFVLTGNGNPDNQAHIWDIRTAAVVLTIPVGTTVVAAVYSPDGKTVLTSENDGSLRLWDAASARLLRAIHGLASEVITFAPDGKSIATANDDHSASLWDVASGQELHHFTGHTDIVFGIAFSPDGRWLATGSYDSTARLWDVASGQELRRFVGHTNQIVGVAFSPDGKWLATTSADKTARLWDVASGQELRRFSGHADGVRAVAFSHDGKLLLTGSKDGTARIWHTDYHDTMRYLCGVLARDFTSEERTQYGITDPRPTCPGP